MREPLITKLKPFAIIVSVVVILCGCGSQNHEVKQSAVAAGDESGAAAQMLAVGAAHSESFLALSQTEGLRNMIGGARAVFISPEITGGAAIIGWEGGTGFLVSRHGSDWSDPVFFKLSGTSVGFQAGGKTQRMLILLMTDNVWRNL